MKNTNIRLWKSAKKKMALYEVSKCERIDINSIEVESSNITPIVKVFHEPILSTVEAVCNLGINPLVVTTIEGCNPKVALNCGSSRKDCDFFRRTNLISSIDEDYFPIKADEFWLSKKITLFNDSNGKTYDNPMEISVLTIKEPPSARVVNMNNEESAVFVNPADSDRASRTIQAIFSIAIEREYDCIILDELGYHRDDSPLKSIIEMINAQIPKSIRYVFFSVRTDDNVNKDAVFIYFHKNIIRP